MEEIKLEPCPFCGCVDIELEEYLPEGCYTECWKVTCSHCSAGLQYEDNEKEAVDKWNNRI